MEENCAKQIRDIFHEVIVQVEAGERLCNLVHGDDQFAGLDLLFENVLEKIKASTNRLDLIIQGIETV
jgi:hypothetical protein